MFTPATFTPESVLVYVGLDRVGDALLKLPFVRGLRQRFPGARITWVAGRDTSVYASVMKPVVAGLIDEVIEKADLGLHPRELLGRSLGGRRFDLIIDTQRVGLASLILWRIPHQRFISPFGQFMLSSRRPPRGYRFPKLMVRQLLDLLELAGDHQVPTPATIEITIDDALDQAAASLLPPGPVYVGFAPGAGGRPKCWPLDRFVAAAKAGTERGRVPVFLIGPQELDWVEPLRSALPGALFPLQVEGMRERFGFSPLFTIALGRRLAASLSNDSGVGHMLAASGTPLVSLFGPTSPQKFTPMTRDLTILSAQTWGGRDMSLIPVAAVVEAMEQTLRGQGIALEQG
ncbi:MAG: glycosyltransferase family 9 protein [Alphaproteobacteria bacterium]